MKKTNKLTILPTGNSLVAVKKRISAMLPEDKSGLILRIVEALYDHECPDDATVLCRRMWTETTVCDIEDLLKTSNVISGGAS